MKVREERRCDGWDFGEGVLGGWIYLIKSTEDLGMKRSGGSMELVDGILTRVYWVFEYNLQIVDRIWGKKGKDRGHDLYYWIF